MTRNNAFVLILLAVFSWPVFALKDDSKQPIKFSSATQSLDMIKNTLIFSGDVNIVQGSMTINADRVIVIRGNDKNKGSEIIEAYGKPVTFSQKQDNGKMVTGQSNKVRYDLHSEKLNLIENASLKQEGSSITGDTIVYLVKEQKMEASSNQGKRVTTILEPSQLRANP